MLPKKTSFFVAFVLTLFVLLTFSFSIHSAQFKLFRTKTNGNNVVLPADAKVVRVQMSRDVKSYTLWRNGRAYITVSRIKNTPNNGLVGVLPSGTYVLKILGSSGSIFLNTVYKPFKVTLWGKQNKIVKPLWDGNVVALTKPAVISKAYYDGTKGMGIFLQGSNRAILHYLSPHNITNPGPRVIGGRGGKTLVGQTLPVGIYTLTPGRGKADGIIQGRVDFIIK